MSCQKCDRPTDVLIGCNSTLKITGEYCYEHYEEVRPKIKNQSEYAKAVLEVVDILRYKSGKYRKMSRDYGVYGNLNLRCALGVVFSEKYGWNGDVADLPDNEELRAKLGRNLFWEIIPALNDKLEASDEEHRYNWTWNQIADELERGVDLIQ